MTMAWLTRMMGRQKKKERKIKAKMATSLD
jgi:hypothetical protein